MIFSHVHFRDWMWRHKETVQHGLNIAFRAGADAVIDNPNVPFDKEFQEIDSYKIAMIRINEARSLLSPVFYGLLVGVTANPNQIKEAMHTCEDFFPNSGDADRVGVVGLKYFAGHSVGNLGIVKEDGQKLLFRTLSEIGFKRTMAVHCEKEAFIFNDLWNPAKPITHCYARPESCEVESVRDQIEFAEKYHFEGRLHIYHVSSPQSLDLIDEARNRGKIKISCGVTPHHILLYDTMMKQENGILLKVNPALRNKKSRDKMHQALKDGRIDIIEQDHAPHTLAEKTGLTKDAKGNPVYMSGFPVVPIMPYFVDYLRNEGFSENRIHALTHGNIEDIFGFNIKESGRAAEYNLHKEYEVDVWKSTREKLMRG